MPAACWARDRRPIRLQTRCSTRPTAIRSSSRSWSARSRRWARCATRDGEPRREPGRRGGARHRPGGHPRPHHRLDERSARCSRSPPSSARRAVLGAAARHGPAEEALSPICAPAGRRVPLRDARFPGEYTFKHALTHDVAYGGRSRAAPRAARPHRGGAGGPLPRSPREHAERLAYHALQGELWPRALRTRASAGDQGLRALGQPRGGGLLRAGARRARAPAREPGDAGRGDRRAPADAQRAAAAGPARAYPPGPR